MSAATEVAWMNGGREQWKLHSYVARADYSFADRYLLSASFRADGSSKFRSGNRWGYFPSVSAGWRVSEEAFFEPLKDKAIQNLKLRASWGKLGNENIQRAGGYYPTYALIRNTTYDDGYYVVFDEKNSLGRYVYNQANPNLKWEVTTQLDLGFDISFLKHFNLEFDYFRKKSKDVLIDIDLPSVNGLSGPMTVNAADVLNKGVELNLSFNKQFGDFSLMAYGNVSHVKNEVQSIGQGKDIFKSSYRGTNITRIAAGEPIGHFWGFKTDGIFRSQGEIDAYTYVDDKGVTKLIQPKAKVGDLKFLDLDKDGKIGGDGDRTNIGSGFPNYTFGFGADMEYKGFDMSFFFQGAASYDVFNALKYEGVFFDARYNQFTTILNRYHPVNNPNGTGPRVTAKDDNENRRMSDYYVEDGKYLRLKNLTFGYTFDKSLTRKIGMQKARIYITMQNLLTFTAYKGFDPDFGETHANEIGTASYTNEIGVDRGQFPQPRTFIMGVNINF